MTATAEGRPAHSVAGARLLAALPLATAFSWLALVYAWQAWLVTTPLIFTDELLYAELSRSFAEHGRTLLRGEPHALESLSVVVRAPAWLLGDGETAYLLAKLIGVVAMTAVLFPAYALARLVASPRAALFAGVAAAAVPVVSYSALLLEEPIAYPFATLAFALGIRALARREPAVVVAAVGAAAVAPFVRGQLVLVPLILAAAALGLAWADPRVRRRRRRFRPWDSVVLAAFALAGAAAAFAFMTRRSTEWETATARPGAMLDHAVSAAGALTIGLGILPVVAALAVVAHLARAPRTPELSALVAVLAAAVPAFLAYTAVKGAWLDVQLQPRVLERNLVYLAPLLLAGAAVWLDRPRVRPVAVVGAGIAVALLLAATPVQLGYPYFEAPGFALAAFANRELILHEATIEALLVVGAVVAAALVLAARRATAVATAAAVLVVGWSFAGEVYAALGFRDFAQRFESGLPRPADWVDRQTGGAEALYLGEQLADANPFHQLEFWNASLGRVWTLDRSELPPGPIGWPTVDQASGQIVPDPAVEYAVVDSRLSIVGTELQRVGPFVLYRVGQPLRLQETLRGVYGDGWMATASAYTRYWIRGPGHVEVTVGRVGWGGEDVPSPFTVRVGPVTTDAAGEAALASVTAERSGTLHSRRQETFRIPVESAPFRVEVVVERTFVPAELDPTSGDARELGAQVAFRFVPSAP